MIAGAVIYDIIFLFYLSGIFFGINESAGNVIIISALLKTIPSMASQASSVFRVICTLAIGTGVLVVVWFPWQLTLLISCGSFILSGIVLIILFKSNKEGEIQISSIVQPVGSQSKDDLDTIVLDDTPNELLAENPVEKKKGG